jgi:hypothetical protein
MCPGPPLKWSAARARHAPQAHRPLRHAMPMTDRHHVVALALSVGLHVVALYGLGLLPSAPMRTADVPTKTEHIVLIDLSPPPEPPVAARPSPQPPQPRAPAVAQIKPDLAQPAPATLPAPEPDRPRASMDAPPAPTAEEWALASTYTLKNSKRYRHTWGSAGAQHDGYRLGRA